MFNNSNNYFLEGKPLCCTWLEWRFNRLIPRNCDQRRFQKTAILLRIAILDELKSLILLDLTYIANQRKILCVKRSYNLSAFEKLNFLSLLRLLGGHLANDHRERKLLESPEDALFPPRDSSFAETADYIVLCNVDSTRHQSPVNEIFIEAIKMAITEIGKVFVFKMAVTLCNLILIHCRILEVNLGGTWIISNANNSISVPGTVPGNVHTALYRNGNISDPYFRFNDFKYRWIAYDNWMYTRTLEGLNNILFSHYI